MKSPLPRRCGRHSNSRWIEAKNHGLPVNHDPKGNLRLPIMLAGKSPQEQVGKQCHPIPRKLPYRRACAAGRDSPDRAIGMPATVTADVQAAYSTC